MVRTPCCDQNGMKKGTWTPEEDRMLVAYVTRYGCWNWRQLPKFAGLKRCGKSCRLRWMNYLRPNLKRGNYSQEEEETIIKLHESLGNRWSAIAAKLPGRTDNEVKNHWHTHLKKRVNHKSDQAAHKSEEDNDQESADSSNNNNNDNNNSPSPNNDEESIIDHHQRRDTITNNRPDHNHGIIDQPIINYNSIINSPSASQLMIIDNNSPLTILMSSPQQPSSSSEVSTSTTDTCTSSTSTNLVAESIINVNGNNDDSLEAFSQFSDNFWTEPFLADNHSYATTHEFLTSLMDDTEFFPPAFDANLLYTAAFYDEIQVGLY